MWNIVIYYMYKLNVCESSRISLVAASNDYEFGIEIGICCGDAAVAAA